jgi:predicted  nucleic acid-binding Zn-ribbon protein
MSGELYEKYCQDVEAERDRLRRELAASQAECEWLMKVVMNLEGKNHSLETQIARAARLVAEHPGRVGITEGGTR